MSARSVEEYRVPRIDIPKDKEDPRYVKSFSIDEEKDLKEFFDEYGFVVVRDVLSKDECDATVEDIWNYLETKGWIPSAFRTQKDLSTKPIDRKDPNTWSASWPAMADEGILGEPSVFTKQALLNRTNPKLHKACSILLNRGDLLVNHDRYGFFRPTKDVEVEENGKKFKKDFPTWKTYHNVHLDMNPWSFVSDKTAEHSEKILNSLRYKRMGEFIEENNEVGVLANDTLHIQGLINLADNLAEDGGFQLIPGFHKHIVPWAQSTEKTIGRAFGRYQNFVVLPERSHLDALGQRITLKAGSVIIWSQKLAHGSSPNDSNRPRLAQFFKIFPATPMDPERMKARSGKVKEKVEQSGLVIDQLSSLQRKMLGLESY